MPLPPARSVATLASDSANGRWGVQANGLFQFLDCLGVPAQLDVGYPLLKVGLGVLVAVVSQLAV